MDNRHWLLLVIFPTSSLAGLAALLRSGQKLNRRAVLSSLLNSGLFGVSVGAIMIHRYGMDSSHVILGISILAGLGGNALLDFSLELMRGLAKKQIDK
jgi:hypothetical protein